MEMSGTWGESDRSTCFSNVSKLSFSGMCARLSFGVSVRKCMNGRLNMLSASETRIRLVI